MRPRLRGDEVLAIFALGMVSRDFAIYSNCSCATHLPPNYLYSSAFILTNGAVSASAVLNASIGSIGVPYIFPPHKDGRLKAYGFRHLGRQCITTVCVFVFQVLGKVMVAIDASRFLIIFWLL